MSVWLRYDCAFERTDSTIDDNITRDAAPPDCMSNWLDVAARRDLAYSSRRIRISLDVHTYTDVGTYNEWARDDFSGIRVIKYT